MVKREAREGNRNGKNEERKKMGKGEGEMEDRGGKQERWIKRGSSRRKGIRQEGGTKAREL